MSDESVVNLVVAEAIADGKADDVKVSDLLKLITDLAMHGRNHAALIHGLAALVNSSLRNQLDINVHLEKRIQALESKAREHEHLH